MHHGTHAHKKKNVNPLALAWDFEISPILTTELCVDEDIYFAINMFLRKLYWVLSLDQWLSTGANFGFYGPLRCLEMSFVCYNLQGRGPPVVLSE